MSEVHLLAIMAAILRCGEYSGEGGVGRDWELVEEARQILKEVKQQLGVSE